MTESLRVLLVSARFPPAIGGVETHVSGLGQVLSELGHDVTVYTTDIKSFQPRKYVKDALSGSNEGLRIIRTHAYSLDPGGNPIFAISPRQFVLPPGSEPDVVHVHSLGFFSSTLPALSPFYSGLPMVLTAHSTPDTTLPRWLFDHTLGGEVIRRMSCVIALTSLELDFLRKFVSRNTELCLIPNGIDSRGLRQVASRFHDSPPLATPPFILYAGRLGPNKGLDVLLRAFSKISKGHPFHRLRLVGPDFGVGARLESLAYQLGIRAKVDLMGEVERDTFIAAVGYADCLVLPSTYGESQGIVLLEALTLGTPVIGTRIGGVPETLAAGRLGTIVAPGNVDELAEAINTIVALRESGSCPPCEYVALSQYDWSRIGKEIAAAYRRALGNFKR